jgi:hypothetical protein
VVIEVDGVKHVYLISADTVNSYNHISPLVVLYPIDTSTVFVDSISSHRCYWMINICGSYIPCIYYWITSQIISRICNCSYYIARRIYSAQVCNVIRWLSESVIQLSLLR